MLMAGPDGVLKKTAPGEPLDKDIYGLSPEEMKNVPSCSKATSSRKNFRKPPSVTSARTRRMRSGSGHTRTNLRCTTTSN
jgi:hypothetical protein